VQREIDGLDMEDFDEERMAREEHNKEQGMSIPSWWAAWSPLRAGCARWMD
jgi:hypothetical protein